MHTRYVTVLLILLLLPITLLCQNGHGFSFDNYSGIFGVVNNPANSVDSKHRWHINGFSFNSSGFADYGAVGLFETPSSPNGFNGLGFSENIDNSSNNNFMVSNSDVLLPSVLYGIHPRHGVGLLLRSRAFSDYRNINGSLWKGINPEFEQDVIENINVSNLNATSHQWKEIGLNYSFALIQANYHYLKIGFTAKYLMGNGATELRGSFSGGADQTNVTLNSGSQLAYLTTFPGNSDTNSNPSFITSVFDFDTQGTGYGGDFGFVYEWRPRETNRVDVRSNSGAVNTYKLKISASILDVGSITYNGENNRGVQLNEFNINNNTALRNADISASGLINTLLQSENVTPNPSRGEVEFALPATLNIGLDYIILNNNNYYVNLNYIRSLTKISDTDPKEYTNSQLDLITLTPRYETRKFSIYLPVTYGQETGVFAGLGARYGPVTIGSAALSGLLTDGVLNHFYVGLSLPLLEEVFR